MTKRKSTPRGYHTFPDEAEGEVPQPSFNREDSDKSRSAAQEAQRLGSQGSWADNFSGGTPATAMTPAASDFGGNGEQANVEYPRLQNLQELSDPPPMYTPTDSNQPTSTPTSPLIPRAQHEPVSSPTIPVPPRSRPSDTDTSSCHLPEVAEHQSCCSPSNSESSTLPRFLKRHDGRSWPGWWAHRREAWARRHQRRKWCKDTAKERIRKRKCWFFFALVACLWLMIPALCKNSSDSDQRRPPHSWGPGAPGDQWPLPDKREYRQHETFRSISGTFQLYDLLDLSTTSGSISIEVEPQPGSKPAVMRLSATAGSINVRIAPSFIASLSTSDGAANRTFQTEISATAGSVKGNLLLGNGGSTSVSTRAGSISVTITTVGVSAEDPVSTISTLTQHGSQSVEVVDGVPFEEVAAIEASHTTYGGGSINVQYPEQWEGRVHLNSQGSGSTKASGKDLILQKQGNEIWGYKGKGERRIEILQRGSGSIKFKC